MKDTMELDLGQLLLALKKRAIFIILITLVFAVIGMSVAVTTPPMYQAHAKMIVNASGNSGTNMGSDQLAASMKLVETCEVVVRSSTVLQPIIDALDLAETCDSLAGKVTVTSVNETPVMQVTVKYSDPEMAKAITAKVLEFSPALIVESIEAGSVKTVEEVRGSTVPIKPSMSGTAIKYGMVGFALAAALFVGLFLLDNTFHTERELKNMLDLPVLGIVPAVESCRKGTAKVKKGKGIQG